MKDIYDNGDTILGTIYEVKDYMCKNCKNYEEVKDIVEELENYDEDTIVVVNYSNGMGCYVENYWRKNNKVN